MSRDEHRIERPKAASRPWSDSLFDEEWARMVRRSGFLVVLMSRLLVIAPECGGGETSGDQRVVIDLRPQVVVAGAEVRLKDIALVRGNDAARRRELEAVDVAVVDDAAAGRRLGRRFIDLRLQLAGYSPNEYLLIGSQEVRVMRLPLERPSDAVVEQLALREVCERWSVPEEEVRVRLAAPVMIHSESLLASAMEARVEVVLKGPTVVGTAAMQLRLLDRDQLLAVRSVQVDIARRMSVVVPVENLPIGSIVGAETVRIEERFLTFAPDLSAVDQAVGRRVVRPAAAGELLTSRHLAMVHAGGEPSLVKARDVVRVTARKGGLTVTLNQAEALQGGKAGQLVRLRNTDSNRVVVGRVVAAGEVEVVY